MEVTQPRRRAAILYGKRLRVALEETGTSIYRLSRNLNPHQPESARSNIQRYLAGRVLPGIESRYELAESLGRPELQSVPEDDEEPDPVADLMSALRAVVQSELSAQVNA